MLNISWNGARLLLLALGCAVDSVGIRALYGIGGRQAASAGVLRLMFLDRYAFPVGGGPDVVGVP